MSWIVESDEWGTGSSIVAAETLARIQAVLAESPIIVEHRFYRGASAPDRVVFDEYEDFTEYVERTSRPGDSYRVWRYNELCRDDNPVARGKIPDDRGRVPKKGPY